MTLCTLCSSFGSWLVTKEVEDVLRFYEKQYAAHSENTDARCDGDSRLEFKHHQTQRELLTASDTGCQLCSMIVGIQRADLTWDKYRNNTAEPGHMVVYIEPGGNPRMYYSGINRNQYVILDVYSTASGSNWWPEHGHRRPKALDDEAISQLNGWIQECVLEHRVCNVQSGYLPTRLLYVGPPEGPAEVRLVETESFATSCRDEDEIAARQLRYVALSHCWGSTAHCITTSTTLAQRKRCILESELNQTFNDAITATRALGMQYLWIDSLCIVQDSLADWQYESTKMCDVYGNAFITVLATAAKDGDQGFLRDRITVNMSDISPTPGKEAMSCLLGDFFITTSFWRATPSSDGRLSTRAWCYQERVLSRRILNFEHANIGWFCLDRGHSADPHGLRPTRDGDRDFTVLTFPQNGAAARGEGLNAWRRVVMQYSGRDLTYQKDKLPALTGLASLLGNTTGSRYLAGMWEAHLPESLVWHVVEERRKPKPTLAATYTAPSWCWASQHNSVDMIADSERVWTVKILECSVDLVADPYGPVRGGFIKLEARLSEFVLENITNEAGVRDFFLFRPDFRGHKTKEYLVEHYWHQFRPDDPEEAAGISRVWCCALQDDSMLVLRNVDVEAGDGGFGDSHIYERVGAYWIRDATGWWDSVEAQVVTII